MSFKFIRTEKFILALMAILSIVLNVFPYVYQYYRPISEKVYVGSYPIIRDKPAYLAEMTQGEEGNWKMIDKYTTEPQEGVYVYTFYILLGHIAKFLSLSVETTFLISRFIFGAALLATIIYFIRYFIENKNTRLFTYFFVFLASGLGWLTQDERSLDLWTPNFMPMVRFSYFPHMMLGEILILLFAVIFFLMLERKNSRWYAILAGTISLILNFVQTFSGVMLYVLVFLILAILFFKNKPLIVKNLKNILLFFALSAPSMIYMYYIGTNNELWKEVEKQNVLISPSPASIASGYGLISIFAICGLWIFYRKNSVKSLFFLAWTIAIPILAYIPIWIYPMQIRFLDNASYAPLAIAAGFGAAKIYDSIKNKAINFKSRILFFSVIISSLPFLLIGNIQNWAFFQLLITDPNRSSFYLPLENIKAMEWLKNNSLSKTIILASLDNSNVIPYYSDRFVYAGHAQLTLDFYNKKEKIDEFFSGKYSSDEAYGFLEKEKIDYVFYSDLEKKSGNFNPENYEFLKRAYQNKEVSVYEFKSK